MLGQVFGELLKQIEPAVAEHVVRCLSEPDRVNHGRPTHACCSLQHAGSQRAQGVNELMYVSPWFMRLFTGFQPWPSAVWMFDQCIQGGTFAGRAHECNEVGANHNPSLG